MRKEEELRKNLINVKTTSTTGIFTQSYLYSIIDQNAFNIVPKVWPKPQEQRGPCCGLYALSTAVKSYEPNRGFPPTRKDGAKKKLSLRKLAKDLQLTTVGEIFDVNSFATITKQLFINEGVAETVDCVSYLETILKLLSNDRTVIVGCDIDLDGFPGNFSGHTTHWALVFGSCVIQNKRYFLVTQYNEYYLWSAHDLLVSNVSLPEYNPKCSPFMIAYKYDGDHDITTVLNIKQKNIKPSKTKRLTNKSLKNFKFGIFSLPAKSLSGPVEFVVEDNHNSDLLNKRIKKGSTQR